MAKGQGFLQLSENEKTALLAFNQYNELMCPQESLNFLGTKAVVARVINGLIAKGLVVKAKPYRLTSHGQITRRQLEV